MQASILLRYAATALVPMQIVFSLFLLLRGHNDPGGGFIAGLLVTAALGLTAIAASTATARKFLIVQPIQLAGIGLLTAILSAVIGFLFGDDFMTGEWVDVGVGGFSVALGSPLLFDLGVYLLVIGVSSAILFNLIETGGDENWR